MQVSARDDPAGDRVLTLDFLFANVANFFVSLGQQMLVATLPANIGDEKLWLQRHSATTTIPLSIFSPREGQLYRSLQ